MKRKLSKRTKKFERVYFDYSPLECDFPINMFPRLHAVARPAFENNCSCVVVKKSKNSSCSCLHDDFLVECYFNPDDFKFKI